ncbi:MAG: hypothetical protein OXB84_05595 [Halobacteriovoraceae bacterium]|nr:hypothetical protein [Halobacteriovoraceae bacterium]
MFVKLADALKAHGLKGNVSFSLSEGIGDDILSEGKEVALFPLKRSDLPGEGRALTVRYINPKGGLIAFREINSKEQIIPLLPFSIYMEKEQLPPLPEGKFYPEELLGASVKESKSGEDMGVVADYYHNKGQLILKIEGKESYELPMVETFFPVVSPSGLEMVRPEFI